MSIQIVTVKVYIIYSFLRGRRPRRDDIINNDITAVSRQTYNNNLNRAEKGVVPFCEKRRGKKK